MDKKIAGLLGTVAGLASVTSAQATTSPGFNLSDSLQASSYAELLAPIPNAVALLKADDAARAQKTKPREGVQIAQGYYYPNYNYNGNYYNPYYGRYYNPYYRDYYPRYRNHHHHHHHHHQDRY